jgi:hypothetical protein
MATSGQYHHYGKITLIVLIVSCVIGALLFIIPTIIFVGSGGTSTKNLSLTDILLTSLSGWGFFILFVEMVFIMVRDWRGAMALRFPVTTQWRYRGRLVRAKNWLFVLYVIIPYIMLPIYLIRTVIDQRQSGWHKQLESKRHIAQSDARKG